MPVMDGYQFLQFLNEKKIDIPLIYKWLVFSIFTQVFNFWLFNHFDYLTIYAVMSDVPTISWTRYKYTKEPLSTQ